MKRREHNQHWENEFNAERKPIEYENEREKINYDAVQVLQTGIEIDDRAVKRNNNASKYTDTLLKVGVEGHN